jgi:hypothetical protein
MFSVANTLAYYGIVLNSQKCIEKSFYFGVPLWHASFLLANIRLGLKRLTLTNAVAYFVKILN